MNIVCITHADFETPGVIQDWAQSNNYNFEIYKPYKGQSCPAIDSYDILIIMGGPQGACDLDKDPYLYAEVALIQEAIKQDKKVIGFCLGAQLIGIALGAPAQKSPEKEVGVFPIVLTAEGQQDSLIADFSSEFEVIHWHNDMPGLTAEAQILAFSKGCPRQIIKYSEYVYGFQCHLEITQQGIETMIAACSDDLNPSLYTQTKEDLLKQNYEAINQKMLIILNSFIKI